MVIRATWRNRSLLSRRRTLGPRVRKDDDVLPAFPFSFPFPVPPVLVLVPALVHVLVLGSGTHTGTGTHTDTGKREQVRADARGGGERNGYTARAVRDPGKTVSGVTLGFAQGRLQTPTRLPSTRT